MDVPSPASSPSRTSAHPRIWNPKSETMLPDPRRGLMSTAPPKKATHSPARPATRKAIESVVAPAPSAMPVANAPVKTLARKTPATSSNEIATAGGLPDASGASGAGCVMRQGYETAAAYHVAHEPPAAGSPPGASRTPRRRWSATTRPCLAVGGHRRRMPARGHGDPAQPAGWQRDDAHVL